MHPKYTLLLFIVFILVVKAADTTKENDKEKKQPEPKKSIPSPKQFFENIGKSFSSMFSKKPSAPKPVAQQKKNSNDTKFVVTTPLQTKKQNQSLNVSQKSQTQKVVNNSTAQNTSTVNKASSSSAVTATSNKDTKTALPSFYKIMTSMSSASYKKPDSAFKKQSQQTKQAEQSKAYSPDIYAQSIQNSKTVLYPQIDQDQNQQELQIVKQRY